MYCPAFRALRDPVNYQFMTILTPIFDFSLEKSPWMPKPRWRYIETNEKTVPPVPKRKYLIDRVGNGEIVI